MPCRNQCLFICKGNILSGFDCCNCRTDTDHTHDRRYKDLTFLHRGNLQKSIHSGNNLYI